MSASMLFNSICIKDMIGSCRPGFNPRYQRNFSVGIYQDLSTLTDFNWIVSMVKSDLMDTYTITDISCGSRFNEYVSGKKNTPYSSDNARYINQHRVNGRKEQKKHFFIS
jgi:hypothetical protein